MYVMASAIAGRHGNLPGGIEVRWQGSGADRGNAVVLGDIGGSYGWHVVRDLAGNVTLHGSVGGESVEGVVLRPVYGYPDTWWTNGTWCAHATGDPTDRPVWTIVRSPLTGWFPRHSLFPVVVTPGTTDPGDLGTEAHGDKWFLGGSPMGAYKRLYPSAAVDGSYAAQPSWSHAGKGDAPAGEYTSGAPGSAALTVGWWDDQTGTYKLGERVSPEAMCGLPLIRTEPAESAPYPSELVSGWDFDGADWTRPDPLDWRYWWAVRCAILEREGALYDEVQTVGAMISDEGRLDVAPWTLPSVDSVRAMREAIRVLATRFVDFDKVLDALRGGWLPLPERTALDIGGYKRLAGGWTACDALASASPDGLSGFLREARLALSSMVVRPAPDISLALVQDGVSGYGYATEPGGSWARAVGDAVADFRDDEEAWPPVYTGGLTTLATACYGWFSAERDAWGGGTWEASYSINRFELTDLCFPTTSVLDGSPMARPSILWARESRKSTDMAVGDRYKDGIVTGVEYRSDFAEEGVTHGVATLPFALSEEPFQTAEPVTPTTPGFEDMPGYKFVGNRTITWAYAFWGASFRYGGPLPDLDQDESEENQNE